MADIPTIIDAIIKSCVTHFEESNFRLHKTSLSHYVISGDNLTKAINNDRGEVNVLHWFGNFWIYFEISFVPVENKFPQIFLSLSVFEGEADDEKKNQLFRAEWDDYDEDNSHPQPHWHIYPHRYHYKTYEDFEAFNDLKSEDDFENFVNPQFQKILDIKKMHFAMNAGWAENLPAVHKITTPQIVANWLQGILGHVKYQINYAL